MRVQLSTPESLDMGTQLPWEAPLSQWPSHLFVTVPRGISRNLVRFTIVGNRLLALKEVPDKAALEEYHLLRLLQEADLPVVDPIAVVTDRDQDRRRGMGLLITHFLEYSHPYRVLLGNHGLDMDRNKLIDAMVFLIVRLHLAGFYWGDCSLSNTLFVRDAGHLAAFMVDAETGEMRPSISPGMREYDLEIAQENITGELLDMEAESGLPDNMDPFTIATEFGQRYHRLWNELNRDEIIPRDETFRINARVRSLNELGFHVEEMELQTVESGHKVIVRPRVVEHGYHKRQLHALTGLDAQENQGRSLVNDIHRFRAAQESKGDKLPLSLAAYRWFSEVYQPVINQIPKDLRLKLNGPEIFHQVLEHRWFQSEAAGCDVGTNEAIHSYQESVLAKMPSDQWTHLLEDQTSAQPDPIFDSSITPGFAIDSNLEEHNP